ncbi:MAG: FecR domain-containing protein [Advenella sp.]|uniref:Iron dicitrate transport regulator FecR n=1 Tax=Advenella kashmirensis TaxID=310575 RepID=A0A356LGZ7_9BURK|nr:iron dicitrate transport regulator FecR [Advenella kashmirensis]
MSYLDAGASGVNSTRTPEPQQTQLVDEAVKWLVLMHSGRFNEADAQRCAHWRGQSSEHQRVWESVEKLNRQFESVPGSLAMPVLNRPRVSENRRMMLKTIALAITAPSAMWLGYRAIPWDSLNAQYRTGTGERRDVALADGSQLSLNTSSAVDVVFDARQRLVLQRSGEIHIQTAHGPQAGARPFVVKTQQGSLQALGTRFVVRCTPDRTRLTVLDGAVQVRPLHWSETQIVPAGQELDFSADRLGAKVPALPGVGQWVQGVLYAEQMRLADFVAELARYRPGILRCDSSVADIPVSGAFQLNNTDRILEALAQTLPVQIQFRTRYWVTVAAR